MKQLECLSWLVVGWLLCADSVSRGQEEWRPSRDNAAAVERIQEPALRGYIRFLADDLLEGRGPGSRGDELSQLYLATQFQAFGYQTVLPDGKWVQPVPLVGVSTIAPPSSIFVAAIVCSPSSTTTIRCSWRPTR